MKSITVKIKKNVWAISLMLVRIFTGLSIQKIIAIKYGPVGTTLLSHFQNLLSLFTQPLQDIVGQGVVTGIGKRSFNNKMVATIAVLFSLAITASVAFGTTLYMHFKATALSFLDGYWFIILLVLVLITFKLIAINFLVAKGKLKEIFFITAFEWLTIIFIIFNFTSQLTATLLWYVSIQGATTFIYYLVIARKSKELLSLDLKIDPEIKHHFFQFLWIGLTIWLSSKLTDFYIRSFAIDTFPEIATGLWQAVARVSTAYKGLFISFSMLTFFPTVSKAANSKERRKVLFDYLRIYIPIIMLFIILIFLAKSQLLSLLYDASYQQGANLFTIQLFGDFLALLCIPFSLLLLAVVDTKRFILAEIISTVIFIAAIHLQPDSNIKILLYAYFIRYLIYLTLIVSFSRKYWRFA